MVKLMAKIVLLDEASQKTGLTKNDLYWGARKGLYPSMRIGGKRGRWAFDLDLLEKRIKELMLSNIKEEFKPTEAESYGKLRRIDN